MRAVDWDGSTRELLLIDQTSLPHEYSVISCGTVDAIVEAVQRLVVRGAPALGAVGAFGVAVAMVQSEREGWPEPHLRDQVLRIRNARPTAVNLAWGVDRVTPLMTAGIEAVVAAADVVMDEDEAANRRLSALGADWIQERIAARPIRVLTHCNTGFLATTGWGTALGIVRELHDRASLEIVYVDETRPLLQGSRLTAWELQNDGIDYVVQVDSAAASTIMRGLVDIAVIGADRIARNGDTANKIGSLGVALACQAAAIPFIVAAPSSTIDLSTATGESIEIELRPGDEVTSMAGSPIAPAESKGFNPAFDVTPYRWISAIITENGVMEPDGSPIDIPAQETT